MKGTVRLSLTNSLRGVIPSWDHFSDQPAQPATESPDVARSPDHKKIVANRLTFGHTFDSMHVMNTTTMGVGMNDRNSRNARTIGAAYAEYGRTAYDVADACGVTHGWVNTATMSGARAIARFAFNTRHDDDGATTMRPWINLVRFARAYNTFARTPRAHAEL